MSFKSLHRYVGLLLCFLILAISLTGVILVWKKEYLWFSVEGARERIDTSLLANAMDAIEQNYAIGEVIFIQLYSEDLSIHKVFLSGKRYAWHDQRGHSIQIWSGTQRWEDFFLDLHHRFLLGNTIGLNIAGFSGLLLLALLIMGLKIWWPRRNLIKLGLIPHSTTRSVIMRSHGNLGAVFSVPVFLLAITGVILVYPVESKTVLLESLGAGGPQIKQVIKYDQDANFDSWANLIELAYERFPGAKIRSAQPSSMESATRTLYLQQKQGLHRLGRSSLRFHKNGDLTLVDELRQRWADRVFGFSYPLHTAKLGIFYRIVVTLVGLGNSLLCILGLLSFLKRRERLP